MVSDINTKAFAFSNVDRWPGKHSIDCDYWLCMTQSAHILDLNLKKLIKDQTYIQCMKQKVG